MAETKTKVAETEIDEPSVHESNKVLRVLKGEKLKYTCRVHLPDNRIIEWQCKEEPAVKYFDEDRCLWVHSDKYGKPIMKFPEGGIILTEENPV